MKKVHEIIKPFLSIIFGALFLLLYLNLLAGEGFVLAIGIIAVIVASYYLALGITNLIIGEKFPALLKKILNLVAIVLFPFFIFIYNLLIVVNLYDGMGPTGWIIVITALVGSLFFIATYIVSSFVSHKLMNKLAILGGGIFVLILLLQMLFDLTGASALLGEINVVLLIVNFVYSLQLFPALVELKDAPIPEKAPKEEPKEEPQEEVKEEEQPQEEQPKEEQQQEE